MIFFENNTSLVIFFVKRSVRENLRVSIFVIYFESFENLWYHKIHIVTIFYTRQFYEDLVDPV